MGSCPEQQRAICEHKCGYSKKKKRKMSHKLIINNIIMVYKFVAILGLSLGDLG